MAVGKRRSLERLVFRWHKFCINGEPFPVWAASRLRDKRPFRGSIPNETQTPATNVWGSGAVPKFPISSRNERSLRGADSPGVGVSGPLEERVL